MAALSYSVAATPVNQTASTLTVAPPPVYEAGDFLVMSVVGTATTAGTGVSAATPAGWARVSASGSVLSVFTKTAGSSESPVTVTMASACAAAAWAAAYPAATVVSSTFGNSSPGSVSYSPSFPSGITSGQLVLVAGAAVTSPGSVDTPVGWSNFNFPAGAAVEVPAFAPALPNAGPYTGAAGLCSVPGSAATGTALFTSGQQCTFYAGFIVLNVTGTASPLTVTATAAYPAGTPGMALTVKALTGTASAAAITAGGAKQKVYALGTSGPPQASITPAATGSVVYGAVTENYGVTSGASFTANGSTSLTQNVADTTWNAVYGTLQSSGTTTAFSAVALGASAPASGYYTIALAEILAASGSSITETASAAVNGTTPGDFAGWAVAQSAVFRTAPASTDLLVAMVSANSNWGYNGGSNASVTVTDSSGLVWTPLAEVYYPSYSGVWIGAPATGGATSPILDEAGNPILDESGAPVLDESGTVSGTTVFGPVAQVTVRAPAGTAPGPATATAIARVSVRAVPGTAGSGIATGAILDEAGNLILDEAGNPILDESGGGSGPNPPPPPPVLTGTWTAARAGLPGDGTAENAAEQASQFLVTHQVTPVYAGNRAWAAATATGTYPNAFLWGAHSAFLPSADVSQPFTLPGGTTAVGRVSLPLLATGGGADLQVSICPDNGSGSPVTASVLATVTVPASHLAATAAAGSLTAAGPLQVSRYNASLMSTAVSTPWAAAATSSGGAGNYACPVTAGNYTIFLGGTADGSTPLPAVSVVQYQGSGTVSGAAPGPALPQPVREQCATATSDTIVMAGGWTGAAWSTGVWTATWDGAGTIGAWTLQAALPVNSGFGAMASSGEYIYVATGSPDGTEATAAGSVYWSTVSGGSISGWTAAPSLPVHASHAFLAVAGNWLIIAGGLDTSGNVLTRTYYAELGSDGTPGSWQAGPALPAPVYALAPGWNLAVTDSAMIIVSGLTTGGSNSPVTMSLSVSPDGPAPEWQLQDYGFSGEGGTYQVSAFPSGAAGNWTAIAYYTASYDAAAVNPVPMASVPLPATGLAPGATYHLVIHQDGGDDADWLELGFVTASTRYALTSSPGSGGPWTALTGYAAAAVVYDNSATGALLHLYEDAGARVTTLVRDSAGDLTGIADSTAFPAGSPETVLPGVVQVTWTGGMPSGLVPLT